MARPAVALALRALYQQQGEVARLFVFTQHEGDRCAFAALPVVHLRNVCGEAPTQLRKAPHMRFSRPCQ